MPRYPFLSPEWIDAVQAIRANHPPSEPLPEVAVRANVIVTDAPFGDEPVTGSIDTSAGELLLEPGHLDDPEMTLTLDYDTARTLLVDRDPRAAMEALLGGKIRVDGDVTRLLVLQPTLDGEVTDEMREMAQRIDDITA